MKKIKVAYIFDVYPQAYQTYIELLMSSIFKNDLVQPSIYAFNTTDKNVTSLKYDLSKRAIHKISSVFSTSKTPLFIKQLLTSDIDIIHVQHSYLHDKFLRFEELVANKKIVITFRGGDTYLKPWLSEKWRSLYQKFGSVIYFVAMSEHQKQYLIKWGAQADRIFVIPISHNNQIETIPTSKGNSELLKIVSVFRMTWEKNIQGSLLLIKKLVDKGIKVQYDLFGDGNDFGEVYYLVDRLGLKDHVNIKGKVAYDDLMKKLKDYHFILQLSVSEALPSSILEAQSFGIPAIISDSGGLPESVVVDGSAVCKPFWEIEELANETISVWQNKTKYNSYCQLSAENSRKFTVDAEIERLVNMYRLILK